jgi:hypothetical protein
LPASIFSLFLHYFRLSFSPFSAFAYFRRFAFACQADDAAAHAPTPRRAGAAAANIFRLFFLVFDTDISAFIDFRRLHISLSPL